MGSGAAGASGDTGGQGGVGGTTQPRGNSGVGGGRTKKAVGSTFSVRGGKRDMKGYPVTKDDLINLAATQGGATLFYAVFSLCFGVWISAKQSIEFADKIDPRILGKWQGYETAALVFGIASLLLAIGLTVYNGFRVHWIITGTTHE